MSIIGLNLRRLLINTAMIKWPKIKYDYLFTKFIKIYYRDVFY